MNHILLPRKSRTAMELVMPEIEDDVFLEDCMYHTLQTMYDDHLVVLSYFSKNVESTSTTIKSSQKSLKLSGKRHRYETENNVGKIQDFLSGKKRSSDVLSESVSSKKGCVSKQRVCITFFLIPDELITKLKLMHMTQCIFYISTFENMKNIQVLNHRPDDEFIAFTDYKGNERAYDTGVLDL